VARSTLAILSTESLLDNLSVLEKMANPDPTNRPKCGVMAMVKANAYGHGLRSVALRLDHKVQSLGVASIDEATALRKAGVTGAITLMEGVFEEDELLLASCERLHVVFHDWWQIKALEKMSLPQPLTCWIKIDTGMGRLGFSMADANAAHNALSSNANVIKPIGILSHLACAEQKDHQLNQTQIKNFTDFIKDKDGPKSLCNSGATINFPQHAYDVVRCGLSVYGVSPNPRETGLDLNLKPVMTVQTRLISSRIFPKGHNVGYGNKFVCPNDMPVGIVAIGYGDGYPRTTRTGAPILVNNKICKIIGRVSMDMAAIDLSNAEDAKAGDPVTLWGQGLPIENLAEHTDNVAYDILTGVQNRVKFYWTRFSGLGF